MDLRKFKFGRDCFMTLIIKERKERKKAADSLSSISTYYRPPRTAFFLVIMEEPIQWRTRERRSFGMVLKEVDENLALFLQMRGRDLEKADPPFPPSRDDDDDDHAADDASTESEFSISEKTWLDHTKLKRDDVDDSEHATADWDCLPSEPGIPSHLTKETETKKSTVDHYEGSKSHHATLKSMDKSSPAKKPVVSRNNSSHKHPSLSCCVDPIDRDKKQPSSPSRGLQETRTASRPKASTKHSALQEKSKSLRPSSSRSSSRAASPFNNFTCVPTRSSTPTRGIASNSSSQNQAGTAHPVPQQVSKSQAHKHRQQTNPSVPPNIHPPGGQHGSSSAGTLKNTGPSNSTSRVRSRHRKPAIVSGLSDDTFPNSTTFIPERPVSASKARPTAPSHVKLEATSKSRRKSCSPARGRAPSAGTTCTYSSLMIERSRSHSDDGDVIKPTLVGSKMVERVVNMRKLAPSRLNGHAPNTHSSNRNTCSFQDQSSGFGRTMSKHSLDMALRHMDIGQITQDSEYTGRTQVLTTGVSDNSVATNKSTSPRTIFRN